MHRRVQLRVVEDIHSPMTLSCFRPLVLIPASLLTGMPSDLLEALIAHEVAHISRFDYAVNLLQNLIEMLLFFHPAVWWISKKIRIERENIADDLAARVLGEPRRLALALQELEHFQFTNPQLAQAAHGGNLMSRIKRLLRPEVQAIHWKAAVTVLGMTVACFGLVAHAANFSESPIDTQQTSKKSAKLIKSARIDFSRKGCQPEYPRESIRDEQTGETRLAVTFDKKGKIFNVEVKKSSGFPLLDNAVSEKLLSGTCRGVPGTIKGVPQEANVIVSYIWRLN